MILETFLLTIYTERPFLGVILIVIAGLVLLSWIFFPMSVSAKLDRIATELEKRNANEAKKTGSEIKP